ncbi:MAG: SagB family peptide dehydrogenase [Campylobacterales bacterium]
MPKFHAQTKHSFVSVRKGAFFLDWRTQPRASKHYPHFYLRYPFASYKELEEFELIGGVSFETQARDGSVYTLRTIPSAGALYPCELYVQARGVEGLVSGLYHYEGKDRSLSLLLELDSDGLEYYFGGRGRREGLSFLISATYFRSSWKYRDRAIRYIFLDSGHQLGGVYAYCTLRGLESEAIFDIDKAQLNSALGFRDDEMSMVGLCASEPSSKEASEFKLTLPYVPSSDYLETNTFIEEAYKESALKSGNIKFPNFFEGIDRDILKDAIIKRRSIRAFSRLSISKSEFDSIIVGLFEFASECGVEIFYTLHMVDGVEQGLYKGANLQKTGDFSQKSYYLSLEQKIGGDSAFTLYFTSSTKDDYQKVNILSGFIAHIIYLRAEILGIGTTGIGAYYDDEVKEFLQTPNNILYLLAVGR